MAIVNRPTHKQNIQDFIDRNPPFDSDPRIQKSEDDTIRDEGADSTVFRVPDVTSIDPPAAAFNANFNNGDRIDVDSQGEGNAEYVITLVGLNDNETGIINILKEVGHTYTFANAAITPFNNTNGQDGKTSIVFFVKVVNSVYIVQVGYDVSTVDGDLKGDYPALLIKNNTVGGPEIKPDSVRQSEMATGAVIETDGSIQFRAKTIEIGIWDMHGAGDGIGEVPVAHGLTLSKIRSVRGSVIIDGGALSFELGHYSAGLDAVDIAVSRIDSTNVYLSRRNGGAFDSASFSNDADNRGWIIIDYIE